jgi:hypothetical protein
MIIFTLHKEVKILKSHQNYIYFHTPHACSDLLRFNIKNISSGWSIFRTSKSVGLFFVLLSPQKFKTFIIKYIFYDLQKLIFSASSYFFLRSPSVKVMVPPLMG